MVERQNMTYSVYQELGKEAGSESVIYCQCFLLPSAANQPDGSFRPITGLYCLL
ncbi:hypothetical protein ACFLT8_01300 [Chloroflexota bacterium]